MTLGLDLSDVGVHAVVVNDQGEVLARADQAIAAGGVADAVREAAARVAGAARGALTAGGVATPWPGDGLPDDVASGFAAAMPGVTPVSIAAGSASALGESWCGAARGLTNVISFAIGEHVTAGLLIDGKVWKGAHGYAGSVGWLALNPVEREDYRKFGGLEAEVAAAGIVRRLVWRIKSGDRSNVVDQVGGELGRLTADHVINGARLGDGVCISVVRDTAKYVGMAISNLSTVLDPEAVVLGGTLALSGDMMLEPIRLECSRRLRPSQAEQIRIVLSTLGVDAVAIGAARAAAISRA